MVAITVILAAVIASFVLGLGDAADEVQPNSSISLDDVDASDNEVTLTLTDGDTLDPEEIVFRGEAGDETFLDEVAEGPSGDEWSVGESITLDDTGDEGLSGDSGTLNVVWEESGGDNSATLASPDIDLD